MDLDPTQPAMPTPSSLRAHHRFWPRRLPHAITPPATSLWDNLETSARRYPNKAALVFFGTGRPPK
jgi:fatty-acyl-CoA synthase